MSSHPPDPRRRRRAHQRARPGRLEPDQAALAEQHIAASDDCRRAYEDALETAAALALAVADSEPPAELRDRILAAARAERAPAPPPVAKPAAPRRRLRLAGLLTPSTGFAVLGVAAAIVFALIAVSQHDSASSARDRQEALVSILSARDARIVPLAPTAGGSPGGRVIVSNGRAALVSSLEAARQATPTRPGACAPAARRPCPCRRSPAAAPCSSSTTSASTRGSVSRSSRAAARSSRRRRRSPSRASRPAT